MSPAALAQWPQSPGALPATAWISHDWVPLSPAPPPPVASLLLLSLSAVFHTRGLLPPWLSWERPPKVSSVEKIMQPMESKLNTILSHPS